MCGRLMSPAQETQSMREIRLLRGRVNRYAYIEKFLKFANFYGSSYYFLKTLFMYHTYRIQTKNATEMTLI